MLEENNLSDNSSSELEEDKVSSLEEKFKLRYTAEDKEYQEFIAKDQPVPPCIFPWNAKQRRQGSSRRYGYRDNNQRSGSDNRYRDRSSNRDNRHDDHRNDNRHWDNRHRENRYHDDRRGRSNWNRHSDDRRDNRDNRQSSHRSDRY